jgi:predicted TIM-barrel fold metal-dependent hydrolase
MTGADVAGLEPDDGEATAGTGRSLTVDCDVHPHLRNGIHSLAPYLSTAWRRRILGGVTERWATEVYASQMTLPKNDLYINPVGAMRRDAFPADGSVPGSDPELLARQLLDGCQIDRAVLIGGNMFGLGALPDPDVAASIAGAYNDWLSAEWLARDTRFRGALVVAPQDPALAVAEIERSGGRPGVVAVLLPLVNVLMGDRRYYPIYEAAADHALPITLHPNSVDGIYQRAPTLAGGVPTYYVEWHASLSQVFQANLISLLAHGVFERFPGLKVVIAEGGIAWLPDVMWRLDKNWEALRDEVPWVKRRPSEYVFDHVRLTSQPFLEPRNPAHLKALLEMVRAERTLLFSSDYPHWDFDNPMRALKLLPPEVRERVRGINATELFGDRLR